MALVKMKPPSAGCRHTVKVVTPGLHKGSPFAALTEKKNRTVSAKILTGAMNAHNTFEEPDAVKEESFEGVAEKDGTLSLEIPACSVICLRIS